MFEVEIKVKILDPNAMREAFLKNGGKYVTSLSHEDTYFNLPKGLRDFKQTDEALRVRKSVKFDKNNREKTEEGKHFLSYKGKKIDTSTKTRQEIEFEIEDGDKMKQIFKTLGFIEVFTVKKERELFEFIYNNYHIEVLIDYLPILKTSFVEVEYLAKSEGELNDARDLLFDFLRVFGFTKEESITKSYLELIADKFKKKS